MSAELMADTFREYMRVIIEGLADDLGPEQTRQALSFWMPHYDEDDHDLAE